MKYERFEDLPVWKAAIELARRVYCLTRHRVFAQPGDLRDQLRRAALSVSNNVAEGFERGTTSELLMFLYIARGSAAEVRSMLHFCERLPDLQRPPDRKPLRDRERLPDGESLRDGECLPDSDRLRDGERLAESDRLRDISDLRSEISDLKALAESCSRQLRAWADTLQNTDIKGQRHLNEQSRRAYEHQRSASAFWKQLATEQHRRVEEWTRAMNARPDDTSSSDPTRHPPAP